MTIYYKYRLKTLPNYRRRKNYPMYSDYITSTIFNKGDILGNSFEVLSITSIY